MRVSRDSRPGGGSDCKSQWTSSPSDSRQPDAALAIQNLQVVYGGAIEAVRNVSLEVRRGQIVALLGSNGAGKSTVLKAVSGVLDAEDGKIDKGCIRLFGHPTERMAAAEIVRRGMVQVSPGIRGKEHVRRTANAREFMRGVCLPRRINL